MVALSGLVLSTCAPTVALVAGGDQRRYFGHVRAADPTSSVTAVVPKLPVGSTLASAAAEQPVPAAPAGSSLTATVDFQPVVAQQPRLRVPAGPDLIDEVLAVDGVAFATAVQIGQVAVAGAQGPMSVSMAAVDPAGFRVLTPQVTADHTAVWERIVEGDAAFTHDAGHRLEVPLGTSVPAADRTLLRIGAYASNGVPPIADAIVSHDTAAELGLQGGQELLISLQAGVDPAAVAAAIAAVTGSEPAVMEEPAEQRAFLTGAQSRQAFEPFSYIDYGDGMISIDPGWVRRNIVSAPMPILRGSVVCHRLMIPQLRGALQDIVDAGLSDLINPYQYGGCWVPRHIDFNPSKPISMHAWGLAVDLNVSTNGLGQTPTMDPRIVAIFDRWGFNWGGRWSRPDGMHFELGALLSG